MSLSVVEQFSFNEKSVRSVHVKGTGECLIAADVYRAVGYSDDKSGRKAIQRHVPEKYQLRYRDVKIELDRHVQSDVPQDDQVLLKEAGLYCFLLRCKMPHAEPFLDWVCEEVLPREVRKLAKAIALLNDDLAGRQREIADLIAHRHVPRQGCIDNVLCFVAKHCQEKHPYYVIRCQKKSLSTHQRLLRKRYPNMQVLEYCEDPNAVHRWAKFKEEVIEKQHYYKNHFTLTEDARELLETALDVSL